MAINKCKFSLVGLAAIGFWTGVSAIQPALAQNNPVENIQPLSEPVELLPQVETLETYSEPVSLEPIEPEIAPQPIANASETETVPQSSPNVIEPEAVEPENSSEPIAENAASLNDGESLRVSQAVISPGRSTRSGPSYIGIGGNIGLGGDTTLGDSGFSVISKIGLTRNLSARPAVVIGDNDPTILLPLTVDFPISSVLETGELNLEAAPFVGGGIAISTGSDGLVRPLISAGIDVPVASRITATAAVNFAFFDDTEVGLTLGAGYSF
jgi:hypothetical protein